MRWIALLMVLLAGRAEAIDWLYFGDSKIVTIMQWQGNGPVFVGMADGTYCYVPADEKNMIAMFYSLHASGKTADIHCFFEQTVESGGVTGHRVHRVVAK